MAITNDQLQTALRQLIDALQNAVRMAKGANDPSQLDKVLNRLSSDLRNISTY